MTGSVMFRRVLALLIAFSIVGVACGDSEDVSGELDRVELQMQFFPTIDISPYVYGIEHGIFERHGIDLHLVPGQGTGFSMLQLNENRMQFAQATLIGYLADKAANDSSNTAVMVVSEETRAGILTTVPATSLEDLTGRKVAIAPFSSFKDILPVVLELQGLPRDAIQLELVVTSAALLLEGTVDAIEVYAGADLETVTLEAENAGIPVYHLDMLDYGLVGYYQVIVVRDETLSSDADLVRRLVAAIVEASTAAIAADDDEVARLVAAEMPGLDLSLALRQWQTYKRTLTTTGAIQADVVITNLGYVRDGLDIPHDLQPDDVYTGDFLP